MMMSVASFPTIIIIIMLKWTVVSMIAQLPLADAFLSSASTPPSVVVSLNHLEKQVKQMPKIEPDDARTTETRDSSPDGAIIIDKTSITTATKSPQRKWKYDLGLGKNKPVTTTARPVELTHHGDNNENGLDPVQFLIEHESVRPYPSPLESSPGIETNQP